MSSVQFPFLLSTVLCKAGVGCALITWPKNRVEATRPHQSTITALLGISSSVNLLMFSRGKKFKKRGTLAQVGLEIYTRNATQCHEVDMGNCGVNL